MVLNFTSWVIMHLVSLPRLGDTFGCTRGQGFFYFRADSLAVNNTHGYEHNLDEVSQPLGANARIDDEMIRLDIMKRR